jgi:hypothetical protein
MRTFYPSRVPLPPDFRSFQRSFDRPLDVEIGCGVGFHPLHYARAHPEREVEGCPMPDCYFKGRPVYVGDICYGSDVSDTYLESAAYADTDEPVDDDDLYELEIVLGSKLYQGWCEHWAGYADHIRDLAEG